jgi:hypothetical protein
LIKGTDSIGYLWNYENADLLFGTNSTERMKINNIGNVGIGRSPQAKLDVNGNIIVGENIFFGLGYKEAGRDFPCNKISLYGIGREFGFGVSVGTLDYFTGSNHRFFTGSGGANFGTERFRITMLVFIFQIILGIIH